jgi:hypothetical protein
VPGKSRKQYPTKVSPVPMRFVCFILGCGPILDGAPTTGFDPGCVKTLESSWSAQQSNPGDGCLILVLLRMRVLRINVAPLGLEEAFSHSLDPEPKFECPFNSRIEGLLSELRMRAKHDV